MHRCWTKPLHKKELGLDSSQTPLFMWQIQRPIAVNNSYKEHIYMTLREMWCCNAGAGWSLLTQVPPSLWLSITAAVAPSSAARRAPASPPDPPPITRKSKRVTDSEAMLRLMSLREYDSDRPRIRKDARSRANGLNISIGRKSTPRPIQ